MPSFTYFQLQIISELYPLKKGVLNFDTFVFGLCIILPIAFPEQQQLCS